MADRLIVLGIGAIIGAAIIYFFFWPEFTEKIEVVEVVKTDTLYITVTDTIEVSHERIKHVYLRDTIIKEQVLNLSRFNGLEATTFGDIQYYGLVAGQLLNLSLRTDFKIPQIENTITRTETKRTLWDRWHQFPFSVFSWGLLPE